MTKFRSKKNGQAYPISGKRSVGTLSQGTVHLGVPRRFGKQTVRLKSSGANSDEVHYHGQSIGSIWKLAPNSYLAVNNVSRKPTKTQSQAIKFLVENQYKKKEKSLVTQITEGLGFEKPKKQHIYQIDYTMPSGRRSRCSVLASDKKEAISKAERLHQIDSIQEIRHD